MKAARTAILLFLLCCMPWLAHASTALFLEQPFGTFGYLNPTGHAAIYLSDVCADAPTHLRRCHAGEAGVVISRYHRVAGYDWLAMPLMAYLYAVDSAEEVPAEVTAAREAELRDAYRREHLLELVPDAKDGSAPGGEWIQLVGASYDRRIYVYQIDTPPGKDDELIAKLNGHANKSHFNLLFHNCADLSRTILNFYYPHSVHRNFTVDLGLTTPKQLARSLTQYAKRHETLDFRAYVLPQVSGTIPRSREVNGVVESFLKTKYVVPVAVFQPVVAAGLVVDYVARGRFDPERNTIPLRTGDLQSLYAPDAASLNSASQSHESVADSAPEGFSPGDAQADVGSSARDLSAGTE
jgi:hypothetical protein